MTNLPTGTVTFLYTDIEGSTTRWEHHPAQMQQALSRHHAIMREAISLHSGVLFETAGDSFVVAFTTAPPALQAAMWAQRTLHKEEWPPEIGEIKVRTALHTGAAEMRADGYYAQHTLNRLARLLAAGHGGQVLVSLDTQQLTQSALPPDTDLVDLGEHWLRDLLRPMRVFQLLAPDLPARFPPLKTLDAPSGASGPEDSLALENPYKGLRAFQENDAPNFFGREALVEQLVGRLAENVPLARFLVVVGPSGSGKSSLVRAGLLPALRRGALTGSQHWLIADLIPGSDPIEQVNAALLKVFPGRSGTLVDQLREDERGLLRVGAHLLPEDSRAELVLVIDQFEEIFTLAPDEPSRVHFLESLCAAVKHPDSRIRVVATLRADFYDRPLLYPDPGELVRQRTEVVLPMSAGELERAIVRPARRVGVQVEEELVAAIIHDVGEQPGMLPLLQYTLTELFERRDGRTMTLTAYRESAGVLGSLSRRADETYTGLSGEERALTRQIFLRLVTLGEGAEDTRRRVRLSEIETLSPKREMLDYVLETFGGCRLLTFDRDPLDGGPTVEVAHEALLQAWPRLREWLDDSRDALRVHRRLSTEAAEWRRLGHDEGLLAGNTRLAQYEDLAGAADLVLNDEERAYLAASMEEQERQEKAERARQARELQLQKRAASRLRVLVAALAAFLVVAVGLSLFAFDRQAEANVRRNQAQTSEATAVANLRLSEAQRLAAQANTLRASGINSELAALLALRSVTLKYTPEGDAALVGAARLDYPAKHLLGSNGPVVTVAYSPDGRIILTGSNTDIPRLWDVESARQIGALNGYQGWLRKAAFFPDGKRVATSSYDGTVRIWSVPEGNQLMQLDLLIKAPYGVAISPDGQSIAVSDGAGGVSLFDGATGKIRARVHCHSDVIEAVVFSPDGRYFLTGARDKTAQLRDVKSQNLIQTFSGHTASINSVAFAPDGSQVLTASFDSTARLWDAATGKTLHVLAGHSNVVQDVAYSPDGDSLLTGSSDGTARIWNSHSGALERTLTGHSDQILAVGYSPNGDWIATASLDKTVLLWSAHPSPLVPEFEGEDAQLSPDGEYLLTINADHSARLIATESGQEVRRFSGHTDRLYAAMFSSDGRYVATASWDKSIKLWNTQTGELLTSAEPGTFMNSLAIAGDGQHLLLGSRGSGPLVWDVSSGELGSALPSDDMNVFAVSYSPGDRYFVTGGDSNVATLWDGRTMARLRRFQGHTSPITSASFSPDGRLLATGSDDKTVRLWDVGSGKELRRLQGHSATAYASISIDGRYLLTASPDGTSRMWDLESGSELRRFSTQAAGADWSFFSPDAHYVVSVSRNGGIRLWPARYQDTVRLLCSRLLRDFTDEERAQYNIQDKEPTCR